MDNVTFERVATGHFDVLLDGAKTRFSIINGSAGVSGHGLNVYGIASGDSVRWIGTLQACKKIVRFTLTRKAR